MPVTRREAVETGSVFRDAVSEGRGDCGVACQAEVIVGGEVPHFSSVANDSERGWGFSGHERAEEVLV